MSTSQALTATESPAAGTPQVVQSGRKVSAAEALAWIALGLALLCALIFRPWELPLAMALPACAALGMLLVLPVAQIRIVRRTRSLISAMENIAARSARGDLSGRIETFRAVAGAPSLADGLIGPLNGMLEEVQRRITALEIERNGLRAVLNSMEEGVVVVDTAQRVLMLNAAAPKILNLSDNQMGRPLAQLINQPELIENLSLAVSASQSCSFEFQQGTGGDKQFVLARCCPFRDDSRSLRGAVAVFHDITELRRLERMRTEFVANVSHELRTPLTSLLGYLETLEEGGAEDEIQLKQFLGVCHRQAQRLGAIVDDLLRLSRLENAQQEVLAGEVDLREVVEGAVEQCALLAEERGLTLNVSVLPNAAIVWADRGLLIQAVRNLIENSINYNRENGSVTVRLVANEGSGAKQWEIAVEDTGIGIPPEALPRIFERFYRVDKARSREQGGTGLGLAIVKHIALAHGASVHVVSEPGKGSTFFLRLKAKTDRAQ